MHVCNDIQIICQKSQICHIHIIPLTVRVYEEGSVTPLMQDGCQAFIRTYLSAVGQFDSLKMFTASTLRRRDGKEE